MPEFIKISRTFLPEILAPGTGLSPITDKSVIPTNNVVTIEDILNGKKYQLPGAGGSWSSGQEEEPSYLENADDYKRKERDLDILVKMEANRGAQTDEWTVKVPGGYKKFPSFEAYLLNQRKKDKPVQPMWASRTRTAQNESLTTVAFAMDATVMVESIDAFKNIKEIGAAFCINKNIFATCAHVVKKYNKNTDTLLLQDVQDMKIFIIHGEERIQASVLAIDSAKDIAVLSANLDCNILPLEEKVTIGEEIFTVGSPHGFENNFSFGHIGSLDKSIYTHKDAPLYMFLDLSVFSGNSGGPAINEDGKVIAMVTAIVAKNGEYGLNAGLPTKYLIEFCNKNNIKFT